MITPMGMRRLSDDSNDDDDDYRKWMSPHHWGASTYILYRQTMASFLCGGPVDSRDNNAFGKFEGNDLLACEKEKDIFM